MVFLIQVVKPVPAMSLFPFYDHFKRVLPGPFSKCNGCLNNRQCVFLKSLFHVSVATSLDICNFKVTNSTLYTII